MDIIEVGGYTDGGTIQIISSDGNYYIDSRIGTTTKGSIFFGYPKKDNSNIMIDQDSIRKEIKDAVDRYSDPLKFNWKPGIYKILES